MAEALVPSATASLSTFGLQTLQANYLSKEARNAQTTLRPAARQNLLEARAMAAPA